MNRMQRSTDGLLPELRSKWCGTNERRSAFFCHESPVGRIRGVVHGRRGEGAGRFYVLMDQVLVVDLRGAA